MFRRNDWSNQGRLAGASGWISMVLALSLSVASVSVAAQTVFEFEDPLEDVRAKIERQAAEAAAATAEAENAATETAPIPTLKDPKSDWAANAVTAADSAVETATSNAKASAVSLAERLGLPTSGLIGMALLAALALALGLFWLLARRRPAKKTNAKAKDRDLYAVTNGARARRTLESGAKITRNRSHTLDTEEVATAGVAATAAKILSDEPLEDDELARAYEAETKVQPTPIPASTQTAETDAAEVKADDPDTWRRPNLERLKASIRDDWKESKTAEAQEDLTPLQKEAQTFAELFGDDDGGPAVTPDEPKSPVLDMLDTFEHPQDDRPPATLSAAAIESGLQASVDDLPEGLAAKPRAPAGSRNDAVRRIKALRESVRAS